MLEFEKESEVMLFLWDFSYSKILYFYLFEENKNNKLFIINIIITTFWTMIIYCLTVFL